MARMHRGERDPHSHWTHWRLPFDSEELTVILEAARIGLGDAEVFDSLVDEMDMDDEYMQTILKKLQSYLDETS